VGNRKNHDILQGFAIDGERFFMNIAVELSTEFGIKLIFKALDPSKIRF